MLFLIDWGYYSKIGVKHITDMEFCHRNKENPMEFSIGF